MNKQLVVIFACLAGIVLGCAPIIAVSQPLPTFDFFGSHPFLQVAGKLLLAGFLAAIVGLVWRADTEPERAKCVRYAGFALLTALLADHHYHTVDLLHMDWQIHQFGGTLLHNWPPPDQYRFLPEGILWWLTLGNGDVVFSYLTYRYFFTFLLCLSIYRLARCYLTENHSILAVFLYGAFYPLSTRYNSGNLLDPMSHLVMLSAFYYCRQRQFWSFFWLFVTGMFIKETMILLAPCYFLMNLETAKWREKTHWQQIILLGAVGTVVFLVCRLPFRFDYNFGTLNGIPESMIYPNLGFARAQMTSRVPVFERYLHPVLFLVMWWPLIVWQRRRLPASLFWTAIYFTVALLVTNLFFGWNYESRNFVPGLMLLAICTLAILADWVAEAPKPAA